MIKLRRIISEEFTDREDSGKLAEELLTVVLKFQDSKKLNEDEYKFILVRFIRMLKGAYPDVFKIKNY